MDALESARKSLKVLLTSRPSTWQRRWRERNLLYAQNREEYLEHPAEYSGTELLIGGREVMQAWKFPLMRALAIEAAASRGHVLEVGFGKGISPSRLIEAGCVSHTVMEPHPAVISRARKWAKRQPVPVTILEGFWEQRIGVFTFYGATPDELPPQDVALLRHLFSEVRGYYVDGLEPLLDCQYYKASRMLVPVCIRQGVTHRLALTPRQ